MVWVNYIAIEPFVRRLWPELLVSWSRLLEGRLRDPRVGRDLLVGTVIGVFTVVLTTLLSNLNPPSRPPSFSHLPVLGGPPAVDRAVVG